VDVEIEYSWSIPGWFQKRKIYSESNTYCKTNNGKTITNSTIIFTIIYTVELYSVHYNIMYTTIFTDSQETEAENRKIISTTYRVQTQKKFKK